MHDLEANREELVGHSARLLDDGLAVGSAGNLCVRLGDLVAITPSGIACREMRRADIAVMSMDGTEIDAPETPSSELAMHLAVYAGTEAGAVVHTHSPRGHRAVRVQGKRATAVIPGGMYVRGAYLHPRHNWFVSAAMTDDDIAQVLSATEVAFAIVKNGQ